MINNVYQLVAPRSFAVKFEDVPLEGSVLIRPVYMAICHADQRYYQGKRPPEVLRKKLPMALIHEACGIVVRDSAGVFSVGEKVVMIPNVPGESSSEIYENYAKGSAFRSSGLDGFMRELVNLPHDRVVRYEGVLEPAVAITEFVSVAVHATIRFMRTAHCHRDRIAIIGDGSLGYVTASVLRELCPDSEIVVIGRHEEKLNLFSFAHERYLTSSIPSTLQFDHAFECVGGENSSAAIGLTIENIKPQGTLTLMGVSERPVPVYTRDVLEKGMTVVGCSRSGRADFETAISLMSSKPLLNRLRQIVYEDGAVRNESDIKRAFATDLSSPFKTAFKWEL